VLHEMCFVAEQETNKFVCPRYNCGSEGERNMAVSSLEGREEQVWLKPSFCFSLIFVFPPVIALCVYCILYCYTAMLLGNEQILKILERVNGVKYIAKMKCIKTYIHTYIHTHTHTHTHIHIHTYIHTLLPCNGTCSLIKLFI
jgi:hypothetical protein